MLRSITAKTTQCGFTLIELLVGLAVGLLVMTGLVYGWGQYVQQSSYLLNSAQLNHDVRATLQVITQDLRRAVATTAGGKSAIQLACVGGVGCAVTNPQVVGDCVVFDANVTNVEVLDASLTPGVVPLRATGYRLIGGSLEMWVNNTTGSSIGQCAATSASWVPVASVGESGLETLVFTVSKAGSRCLSINTTSQTAAPCAPAATESVELLLVDVSLSGTARLSNRNSGAQSFAFSDRIKIRNDSIFQ